MAAPELERRLAAIVAADVEGYSRLMHSDEEATMSALSARRTIVDDLIAVHRGRIANTAGDSVLAEFVSVLDAVSCAIEIQKSMDQANAAMESLTMRFRIGINVGDVMVKDGDIFGDGVNVASRLEALSEGGGICVSRGVRDHLQSRANLVFEDLGEQLVKNISHPIRAFRLRLGDTAEVAIDAPSVVSAASNDVALELALWESVKDGGAVELDSYLERYPDGTFSSLARTRQHLIDGKVPDVHLKSNVGPDTMPDALDLAFWNAIKESQRPEEFVAYLERHPDGHFATLARARLSQPVDDSESESPTTQAAAIADSVELAFWEAISDTADPRLLYAYLEKYPEGEFVVIARARLEAIRE